MRPPVSHPHSCTFLSFKFSFKNFICATCTVTALGVELWMRTVCASAKIPTKVFQRGMGIAIGTGKEPRSRPVLSEW